MKMNSSYCFCAIAYDYPHGCLNTRHAFSIALSAREGTLGMMVDLSWAQFLVAQ